MAQFFDRSCTNPKKPIVVKLGGSLSLRLPELVPILRDARRPVLVVPGGGQFADMIRKLQIGDESAAHWMAVAAMEQYGWFVASYGLEPTDVLAVPERPAVLLPYKCMRDRDPLPHSWDITSDTIAAWIAGVLGLDLVVLKSVDGITIDGITLAKIQEPVETDVVDPCFLEYVLEKKVRTMIMNGSLPGRVAKFLKGDAVPGTVIGTTF